MNLQSTSRDNRTTLLPHSCVICQRRKVKCDKTDPCSNCVRHRVVCEYRTPALPKRRKRTSPDPDIHTKLRRYEEILQKHGLSLDEMNGIDEQEMLDQVWISDRTKSEASRTSIDRLDTAGTAARKTKNPQSRCLGLHHPHVHKG